MKLCAMAHIPLAACALTHKTGGSRRRQGAAVPIGTKKMVEQILWIWMQMSIGFGEENG